MPEKIARRTIITMGTAAGCFAVGGSLLGSNISSRQKAALPWAWKEIKPEDIQERAYQSAWSKIGCMYGVVEAVLGTLADKYGAPYDAFPIEAVIYGSGGIGGIGSLCGTVNASGLLFNLFAKNQDDLFALCREISLWYENAKLPAYTPKKPKENITIVPSTAHANLCHISSTTWSNVSGHKLLTPQHFERCNRLVADVAAKAVTMLNAYCAGRMVFAEKQNSFSQGCQSCHAPGKVKANVASSMSCDTCHKDPH